MKKRQIEKVPWLEVKEIGKEQFVLAAAWKNIKNERHLILDIYRKKNLKVPELRAVYTKKDWALYWPEQGVWKDCKLKDEYGRLRWEPGDKEKGMSTFVSEEMDGKILRFAKPRIYNQWMKWHDVLSGLENKINWDRQRRSAENKQAALNKRLENTTELPKEFAGWVKDTLFSDLNFIFYKRKGRYATFTCSHCGKTYKYPTKRGEELEGQFEHVVEVPRNGNSAQCELCGVKGIYKTAGKMKDVYGLTRKCYAASPYRETGAVIRYIYAEKILAIGRPEEFIVTEIGRNYFDGKNIQKDYYLHNGWTGKNKWCYHNIGWNRNIAQEEGRIYPGSYEALKGTLLQYSGIKEYMENHDTVKMSRYMEMYQQKPYLEMLSKLGMYHLAEKIVDGYSGFISNENSTRPDEILGIYKNRLSLLIDVNGELSTYNILKAEKAAGAHWSEKQIEGMAEINPNRERLLIALKYMSVQQLLNRIEKYAGCEFGTECSGAISRLTHTSGIYLDYLQMREQRGYDLSNTVFLFPRNLEEEHHKMVEEINHETIAKRGKEVEEKFPGIQASYRTLRKQYFYEDENFIIRPARSAEEIVKEGRTLHHCVGGDSYLRNHDKGTNIILLLRHRNMKETPYITVEIKNGKVIQWYGEKDNKVDKGIVQPWLDGYERTLKQGAGSMEHIQGMSQEVDMAG